MSTKKTFDGGALKGCVAVVTGASGGIGNAIVNRLYAMGAVVVEADIAFTDETLQPERRLKIECDIAKPESVQAMADFVRGHFGRCDVLVNNAAISAAPVALENFPIELWDQMLTINLRGALLCAQAMVPMMFQWGNGSIINIASIAAQVATRVGAYGTAKAGVIGLTHQMAVEWGPRGIRTNSVSPGMIRTPLSEAHYRDENVHNQRVAKIPLRKIGQPDDVAGAVAFFASDASSYINGQDLVVDGGFLKATLANTY
jgi:NAD(P)-dependent dehydrogenase (short-subunit alcohol dehydrogenase family)